MGLLVLFGVPVAALLVAVTLIGIPLALSVLVLYVAGLLLAWPAAALVVGTQLARLVSPERPLPVLGAVAVGLIVLHVLTHVPVVGGLVALCGLMFGLGLLVHAIRRWRRPAEQPPAAAPLAVAA